MEKQRVEIALGKYNNLEVIKELEFGMYLDGGDEEILIPRSYIPEGTKIGDFIDVFLYRDSEDRLIATTMKPFAQVGEFAYLTVKDINQLGVFLDWGLVKDLLVPFGEQSHKMAVGRKYLVYIYVDTQTERIVASAKIDRFLPSDKISFSEGQKVSILPYEYTDLGIKCLIENNSQGVLYKNELFKNVNMGSLQNAFIKKVREDGKIDLTLEIIGFDRIEECKITLLNELSANNNFLELNDKTAPEVIYASLQMSKKDFKKAVGGLLKEGKIQFYNNGISLL
ncbi:S1 RNA-binding domain-containing protein [Cellulophaga sp. BC115SP]|uniref:CvfB family protein n=1 Tax=Cellulophaga sp. BC115SP TaxID=2683263 RepID=UPI0014135109|nr:S1-like domain-containing RNA-binding protein [Cellulophaga sp. BC115SP]NBB27894.1 GntR family transcriptional regulator [Cellulophaga sp. BC115SP]